MRKRLAHVALLIPDYNEALAFFMRIGFVCLEDTDLGQGKRWIRVAPHPGETEILQARAADENQTAVVGRQGGGRVWLFLETEDFEADYRRLEAAGARFEEEPRDELYGRVAVWMDPWGKRWDLIARKSGTDVA